MPLYVDPGATALDDFDGDLTANIVVTGDNFDTNIVATNIVNYTVTDSGGLTASANRTVNVVANAAPVMTLLGANPLNIIQTDPYVDPGATAIDDHDGDISGAIVVSGDTVDVNTPGTYLVDYTATDAQGLSSTITRTVQVLANLAPVVTITGPNPETVVQSATLPWVDQGATALDDHDGALTPVVSGTVDRTIIGVYTVNYTATDAQGLATTATRTVNVIANTPPTVTIIGDNPQTVVQGT